MNTKQPNTQIYKFQYVDKEMDRQTGNVYYNGKEWRINGPGMEYEFIKLLDYQGIYYPADIEKILDYIQKTPAHAQEQFNLLSEWIIKINDCRPEGLI